MQNISGCWSCRCILDPIPEIREGWKIEMKGDVGSKKISGAQFLIFLVTFTIWCCIVLIEAESVEFLWFSRNPPWQKVNYGNNSFRMLFLTWAGNHTFAIHKNAPLVWVLSRFFSCHFRHFLTVYWVRRRDTDIGTDPKQPRRVIRIN